MRPIGPVSAKPRSNTLPWAIAVGAITFALGVSGTLYLTQSSQRAQAETLSSLVMQLSDIQVSRAQSADLLAITAPTVAAPSITALPEVQAEVIPVAAVVTATIPSATQALSAAPRNRTKEAQIAEAISIANRNQLRMLTEGVVAGLYSVTAEASDGSGTRIALQSRNAATTAEALAGILAEAAANGEIEVPDAVNTSDGILDPQTLLFDLVQRSLENGSAEEVAAARELQLKAFAASTAKTEVVAGKRFYTVESGDSLAYISLQFYGSTSEYGRIFDANRDKLSKPDQVQIGQRLRIPNA
jgi:nucleoid-associated protein YgaU